MNVTGQAKTRTSAPANPDIILLSAILLPGSGHVWLGLAQRALAFLFFMVVLGWVTSKIAGPDVSFAGRHAGGLFIYAISIMDAYRLARMRYEHWRRSTTEKPTS